MNHSSVKRQSYSATTVDTVVKRPYVYGHEPNGNEGMMRSSGPIGGGDFEVTIEAANFFRQIPKTGKGMKTMRNSSRTWMALTFAGVIAAGSVQAQLFETSFETGDGYSVGDLNTQDSWSVNAGTASVTNAGTPGPPADGGSQYVTQDASSEIERAVDGSGSDRVLFCGWYYGTGSQALAAPGDTDVAVLLGFEAVDAGNFTVKYYDGSVFQGTTPVKSFSNTAWHKVIVNIRYDTATNSKTYDVKVNGEPCFQVVDFVDDTVAQLNGFKSFSSSSASIDLLRFESSDGDFDGDGTPDDEEMTLSGRDPFVADNVCQNRDVGDFDCSDCTDVNDFLILLDNWQGIYDELGPPAISANDFLNLLDNWQTGSNC